MSVSVVARKYEVHPNQLFRWRRLFHDGALVAVPQVPGRRGPVAAHGAEERREAAARGLVVRRLLQMQDQRLEPGAALRQPPQGLSAWSLTHKALTFWTMNYTRDASTEAIDWLEQAIAKALNAHPDLVLMDISLPEMDGYAVCEHLRDIDKNKVPSFASEPIIVYDKRNEKTIELEDYIQQSDNKYNNYQGKGYVETNNSVNTNITLPFSANKSGVYTLKFRYANGNGPVNTENKCAIRSLKVDGSTAGTTVFPQRGANEWSNWGYTNSIQIKLSKGKHLFEINLETKNENMNTEINQALIDAMIIYRVK